MSASSRGFESRLLRRVIIYNLVFSIFLLNLIVFPRVVKTNKELPKQIEVPIEKKAALSGISADFSAPAYSFTEIKKSLPVADVPGNLADLFAKYSQEYSVDQNILTKIADCESHFHAGSINGDYAGMFQYGTQTWQSTRSQMGLDPNPDLRFNAEEAIKTTAFKIAHGGISSWPVCGLQ